MTSQPIGAQGKVPVDPRTQREIFQDAAKTEGVRGAGAVESPQSGSQPAPMGEKLEISEQARRLLAKSEEMSAAKKSLEESPELRQERLREVRERLRAGVYDTKAVREELAHRLGELLGGAGSVSRTNDRS